ncbi:hypothetical protein WS93_11055 [Burkholderia cepacia]|nr:hypothetical protein WS93_11055 [Burkholderia cepacia]
MSAPPGIVKLLFTVIPPPLYSGRLAHAGTIASPRWICAIMSFGTNGVPTSKEPDECESRPRSN